MNEDEWVVINAEPRRTLLPPWWGPGLLAASVVIAFVVTRFWRIPMLDGVATKAPYPILLGSALYLLPLIALCLLWFALRATKDTPVPLLTGFSPSRALCLTIGLMMLAAGGAMAPVKGDGNAITHAIEKHGPAITQAVDRGRFAGILAAIVVGILLALRGRGVPRIVVIAGSIAAAIGGYWYVVDGLPWGPVNS